MSLRLRSFVRTERFERDFKAVDRGAQDKVLAALGKLLGHPVAACLRHRTLSGYNPKLHVVDVLSNHAHQVTFEVEGDVARLIRVSTHRKISASPR